MHLLRAVEALQPRQQRAGQMLPPFRKGDEAHAEAQHQEGLRRETAQAHELVHEPQIPLHSGLRVDDRRFTAPPPFERVKEEVIALMEKEQRRQRIEARLKVLRAAASIQKLDAGPV